MQCFASPPEDQDMQEAVAVRLRPLMRKAFRGNADEETYQRYIDYALKQWRSGKRFTDSMKAALAAILSSPRFLYLYQEASVETTLEDASLKGLELASRLSFFLWGSLPDEPLLEAALTGLLTGGVSRLGFTSPGLDAGLLSAVPTVSSWVLSPRQMMSSPSSGSAHT